MALQTIPGRAIELGSDAEGDLAYYDGSKWTRLAKGTAGQLLATNSGATAPEWVASLPAAGTDGNVLTSDGTSWASEAPSGGVGELVSHQLFTAGTGNWTKPANVTKIRVWVIGPGGGSGHEAFEWSGVGGGGGCAMSILDVTNVTTYPYVIGTTAVAGNMTVTAVNSTFNTTIIGGAGGSSINTGQPGSNSSFTPGASGGTAAGGQINLTGGHGSVGGTAAGPLGGNIGRGSIATTTPAGGRWHQGGNGGGVFIEEYA